MKEAAKFVLLTLGRLLVSTVIHIIKLRIMSGERSKYVKKCPQKNVSVCFFNIYGGLI